MLLLILIKTMSKFSTVLLFFLFCYIYATLQNGEYIVPPISLISAPYDIWAHYHWIWYADGDETQSSILKLVSDYAFYDIPVGAVNLDASWPSKFENFIWNPQKFPNASQMVDSLHQQNIKVICWITSTINNDSTNFIEGKEKGYYLNNGQLINWWLGHAALLDYSNPDALDWWHNQMDMVLDIGIDGWKCDGTDPYVFELIDAHGYQGHITEREYADFFYRDFFYYTRQKRGPSALIMARPLGSFDNLLYLKYAPEDVMFSGWVGDQTGNWDGMKEALQIILHSAWNNYLNFGSDIGGYRTDSSSPLGRTKEVFTRWFQMGTFLPLMENGGNGEHRPWIFGNDTLETYRIFAHIHTDLAPYFLNAGTQCYAQNISVIKPLAKRVFIGEPSTYDYLIYKHFYISPFTDNTTSKLLKFPEGNSSTQWVYWFNQTKVFNSGQVVQSFNCSFNEYPAFVISGSIIPLKVQNKYSGLGTTASKDYTTLLITRPKNGVHKENIHEFQSNGYSVEYRYNEDDGVLDLFISAHETNKFIIVVSSINGSKSNAYLARSTGTANLFVYELLEKQSIHDEFWYNSNGNGVFFDSSPTRSQLFVRVAESASKGLHIKVKDIHLV